MKEQTRRLVWDYGAAIFFAVVVALIIRVFVLEAYRIPNYAMKPTLEAGDTIFVNKMSYFGSSRPVPERGDIVVFTPPTDPYHDYIKRVIAIPGDTVEMKRGRLSLNGKALDVQLEKPTATCGTETLPNGRKHESCWETPLIEDFGPEKVPPQSVFVLGDLRSKHKNWGMMPIASIKGRAVWIWLSVEPRTGWFPQFRFERMFRRVN